MTKEARIYNGEKTVSLIRGTGKMDSYGKQMKLEYSFTLYTKVNSKWIKDLNAARPDIMKLLRGNHKLLRRNHRHNIL